MKTKKIAYIILFFSGIVFLVSVLGFYFYGRVLQEEFFYSSVNVTKFGGGFDLNESALTFGNVAQGGSSTRAVLATNSYPYAVDVYITCEGSICKILNYDEKILLNKGESKKISFTLTPDETVYGKYTGLVKIKMTRAD